MVKIMIALVAGLSCVLLPSSCVGFSTRHIGMSTQNTSSLGERFVDRAPRSQQYITINRSVLIELNNRFMR